MSKSKYLIKKVAVEGEDVRVDAEKFDAALGKMLAPPKTNQEVIRLAASRPKPKAT